MAPLSITDFKQHEKIGKGAFGVVYRYTLGDRQFAAKVVPKSKVQNDRRAFRNELTALRTLDHPNIVKLQYFLQDEENLYLLTELCSDDLFEIISKQQLTAINRKKWIKQAAQALKYLHDRRVVHRDIKPENMLICGGNLKLIDFGFATRLRKNQKIKGLVGTPTYMAPEILSEQLYDTRVDLWSLGVVIYVMFFARYPFDRPLGYRLKNQIISGRYIFPADVVVSNAAKDLIIGLLQTDPKQRITIEQVLEHPYLN